MHPVEDDPKPPPESSPPSSSAMTAAEDVRMEETAAGAKETTTDDKIHFEVTPLPNKENQSPAGTQLPPPSSNHPSSSSPAPATDVKQPSPSPSSNSAVPVASGDEKSKKPVSSSAKPKSTKRRSPSPEPLPRPPPRIETIRLEISLGGPDNYAVDITQLAKQTGQRPPTPPPPLKQDSSESEGEDAVPKGRGRGKAGRRSAAAEYYDLDDPFIDDSELAIDERTFIAQTKQQGFYVSSGEVALLKDKSRDKDHRDRDGTSPARKPKSKRNLVPSIIPLAGSQAVNAASTALSTASNASRTAACCTTRPSPTTWTAR